MAPSKKHKISVIGSGNWGTTIAKIIAENTAAHPELFEKDVEMWVYEEQYQLPKDSPHASSELASGKQPLSRLINHFHENVKYLPDIKLPKNLHANPDIKDSVKNSTILVFNLPHQFIDKTRHFGRLEVCLRMSFYIFQTNLCLVATQL